MQAVVIDDKIKVRFIQTRNIGYDRDNVIMIPKEGAVKGEEETFLTEVTNLGGVLGAFATGHDMTGHNGGTYGSPPVTSLRTSG